MPDFETEKIVPEFSNLPPVGDEDWRYTFATAEVRALELRMLSRTTFMDMVQADTFEAALEVLSTTEYAPGDRKQLSEIEQMLLDRRRAVRDLFADLMIDEPYVTLFRARDDFANMRLAVKRTLVEKPLGTDYSSEGNIDAETFEEVFEQENYGEFPEHMQDAVEAGVLAYYPNKDICEGDNAIDKVEAAYKISMAKQLKSRFLLELFRMQIDLTNIRTLMRLKFLESDRRDLFLENGYIDQELLRKALDSGYEMLPAMFTPTPYHEIIEKGVNYFTANQSFIRLETLCEQHALAFLESINQIAAGPQPVIAHLLRKEHEIRTIRFILTAKKNLLDNKLITDRLGHS